MAFVSHPLTKAARRALATTDWSRIDAMTDADILHQIALNPLAAPDLTPILDVRAIRATTGLSQAHFAAHHQFDLTLLREWERGTTLPDLPSEIRLNAARTAARR